MEKNYESDEIEIDLKDLFFELLSEWKKIVVSTILGALILLVVSKFIITPQFTSMARLYVFSDEFSIGSIADLQMGSNLTSDYMEIINSRPVLDQVIDNLDLDMNYRELLGILQFGNPNNSRILEITATHPDPQTAKAIADEVADVAAAFIEEKMDISRPSILQYGYVANGPVSPNVTKNTVLGGLAGAFLAMAVIVIAYIMNDTIMTPDDMERKVGIQVLASLPFDEEEDDGTSHSSDSRKKSAKTEKKAKKGGAK